MNWVIGIIVVGAVAAGLIWTYIHSSTVNRPVPLADQKKIETDFDAKKKAEHDRIAQLDQEELLADLNHRNRPGGS